MTIENGIVGVVTFTSGGSGYVVGDTVGLGTLGSGNASSGSGAIISVGIITATNTLKVDNVQGTFNIGVGTVLFNSGSAIIGLDGKTGIGTTVDGQSEVRPPYHHLKLILCLTDNTWLSNIGLWYA